MTRTEKAKSARKSTEGLSVSSEPQDCAQMFCNTLANLNRVYEEQLTGFARIAVTMAEAYVALSSSKRDEAVKGTAGVTSDELTSFVEQLKGVAAASPQTVPEVDVKSGLQNPAMADAFCAKVEYILLLAMQNSVNQQQQLCVAGQAILALGADRLLSVSATLNTNKKT
jgi:hypothetical protein